MIQLYIQQSILNQDYLFLALSGAMSRFFVCYNRVLLFHPGIYPVKRDDYR